MVRASSVIVRILSWLFVYLYVLEVYIDAKSFGCSTGTIPLEVFIFPINITGIGCLVWLMIQYRSITKLKLAHMAPYITGLACTLIGMGFVIFSRLF